MLRLPFVVHNLFRDPLRRTLKVCARRTLHLFAFRARLGEDLFRLLTGALLGLRHQLPRLHVGVAAAVLDLSGSGALLNGDAADAAAVKAEQVEDSKTVESLGKELKAMAPEYEGCVAEDAQGLDAATVKLNEQADWYGTHEKSLSKAVRAVTESKAAKRLDDAKTNLTAKLDEAAKLLTDSDGKVQDNTTRETLTNAIDAATRLKDANDATKIDKARKTLEDAINGVNASVQAKTDADAQAAAAAAAAAQVQAQSTYSGGSSYSGNTYRRTGGSTSGSNTYRGTTSGGSGSNSGSGSTGGSTTRPNLNGAYGCTEDCYVPPNNLIQH